LFSLLMNKYDVIAGVLWGMFGLAIVAAIVGVLLGRRHCRGAALGLLFGATVALLLFSFIAGFSIGRFTAVLPVLMSGYMVATGRSAMVVATWLLAAGILYLACSWLLTSLVLVGGVFAVVLGFWAVPCTSWWRSRPSLGRLLDESGRRPSSRQAYLVASCLPEPLSGSPEKLAGAPSGPYSHTAPRADVQV
jgi:hypothetical protein